MKANSIAVGQAVEIVWGGASSPSSEDAALIGRTGVVWEKSAVRPGDWWVILDDPERTHGPTVSVRSRDLVPA